MNRDIKGLASQMTLEEKAGMCSGLSVWHLKGVERLGIPSIMVANGPNGLHKQAASEGINMNGATPSTCFPTAAALASTWNRELIHEVGVALGEICQAENVAVLLGPGTNIKRSPLGGRNFEYFSEDPYLSSELAASQIQGVQSQGVGTSLKHFAVNNQEHLRMSYDAIVDERTLREIYLASFEGAVKKGKPWTVMTAYNKINGTYASQNEHLLDDVLRKEWGFEGVVVSDWGAVDQIIESLAAGLELEMPGNNGLTDKKIIQGVRNETLPLEVLDSAVERILELIFKHMDNKREHVTVRTEDNHALARRAAGESIILLKNSDGLLPLPKNGKIAILGALAQNPKFQGGGSAFVVPTQVDIPVEEMKQLAHHGDLIAYAPGYAVDTEEVDGQLIEEAKQVAGAADIAVIVAGIPDGFESELSDRRHLRLPYNQEQLIEAVAAVHDKVVVVLMNGSALEMPWASSVPAIVEAYLGGQAIGGALADILYGEVNPSGKLAETFPVKLEDNPSYLHFPGEGKRVEYKEGIFVGYRYYDTKKLEPLFPFGHGLSYTTFAYSDLKLNTASMLDTDTLEVQVTITNTGELSGKEIVQLYVKDTVSTMKRPDKELKDFAKVDLEPGEQTTVTFTLGQRAFAYYNAELKDWHVESGEFAIMIGSSSRNIALQASLEVHSTVALHQTFTRNSLLGELMTNPAAASMLQSLAQQFQAAMGISEQDEKMAKIMQAALATMPLRNLVSFSQGAFTDEMLEQLLGQLNGHH
ncbi:glycoside hydrolase family 3 C-terminal domain-containing protein [Paenibacillus glycanilyticus]|uniref:Glycosyl hydrolase n=1 Tax=Paenibacillus glycanilyticus TaxID=126569 RepID=A0ABQ6GBB3_9BACL|nr:glycoside hydrolase family 3 C-terminal domain-containing protein [Paenibacillus glycanilyticus]GLX67508.1 glycosyl hydrolase [Paenibacillus glycanilyticus]